MKNGVFFASQTKLNTFVYILLLPAFYDKNSSVLLHRNENNNTMIFPAELYNLTLEIIYSNLNSMSKELDCALDLLRRLPPQNIEKDLSNLVNLTPDLYEELLSSVDQPLKVRFIDLTIFSPG